MLDKIRETVMVDFVRTPFGSASRKRLHACGSTGIVA